MITRKGLEAASARLPRGAHVALLPDGDLAGPAARRATYAVTGRRGAECLAAIEQAKRKRDYIHRRPS